MTPSMVSKLLEQRQLPEILQKAEHKATSCKISIQANRILGELSNR